LERPLNPLAVALAAGATFIARSWSGDVRHLIDMMVAAIQHPGAALLDIFQPCVVFNPHYGFDYFRERVYKLEENGHDPSDRDAAWAKAYEGEDHLPIGVIYRAQGMPAYEDQVPALQAGPLVDQPLRRWTESDYIRLEAEYV
jgi:2-oxoglutarate ferredoxin oxidoreductase subunit beta